MEARFSDSSPSPTIEPRYRWLGLFTLPYPLRKQLLEGATHLGTRLGPVPVWAVAGAVLGALPVVFDFFLGWYTNWLITPFLVFPFLLAAAVRDSTSRAVALLGFLILAHNLTTIALAANFPEWWAEIFPKGAAYWDKSCRWIVTGESEEYQISWWLPAQSQLIVAVAIYTYLSLGLIPLWQGLFEVDLMNFYVSQLLLHSDNPLMVLAVGWHPWSVCRGIGYLFLTFELTSFSLERMVGTPLSTPRRRLGRWLFGLAFLAGDMVIKLFCLEPVREILAGNLHVSM